MSGPLAARSLRPSLRRTAVHGFAHVEEALDPAFARALWGELGAGPTRRMAGSFGAAGVRMEIDGFDVEAPFDGFPNLAELASAFGDRVRAQGAGIRGLATWRPNEAGVGIYHPASVGITSHLDGRWYRRLVAVFTLVGSARFTVRAGREGDVVDTWRAAPLGLTLMRAPGLAGVRDGRPFHAVEGPRRGVRCSVALRMRSRAPG